jgi:hypothetical protein
MSSLIVKNRNSCLCMLTIYISIISFVAIYILISLLIHLYHANELRSNISIC